MAKKISADTDTQARVGKAIENLHNALADATALMQSLTDNDEGQELAASGTAQSSTIDFDNAFTPLSLEEMADGEDEALLRELGARHHLEFAIERLIALRNERYPQSRPRYWGIVNFDLHSSKPRLFVLDLAERDTKSYLCAHGKGSEGPTDDGYANVFSNVEDSNASSLGIYRCAETYQSTKNGYSLCLDGLEETNSRARSRYIVMHGADYVSEAFAKKYGRIGRSEGCPALDRQYSTKIIDQMKQGSFLLHWKSP
ncbi:murein L,D-transpeptidase catalytic domain family protein [Pararhizobium gei]|uniref:murein L,D-transpeptidase catalytic domain family protein n=1 Tax=Pararhizobium gei TaxID=1395951 RepID=UPI0023D9834F|nr:murein L,D-transpeptidase catalytic domain family protein [Rhizobium gei]